MKRPAAGFTLIEVVMALALLALLTGGVYAISSAALDASRSTLDEQFAVRRLESFIRVTRSAFQNLPREGEVFLRMGRAPSGAPVPEIVFREAAGLFGIPSLGGGSLVLAARPRADGSRTFAILRVPRDVQGREADRFLETGPWIPLLPRVEKVRWLFFQGGEWREEWPEGSGRPVSIRLQAEALDVGGRPIDVQFWVPQLSEAPPAQPAAPSPTPSPAP